MSLDPSSPDEFVRAFLRKIDDMGGFSFNTGMPSSISAMEAYHAGRLHFDKDGFPIPGVPAVPAARQNGKSSKVEELKEHNRRKREEVFPLVDDDDDLIKLNLGEFKIEMVRGTRPGIVAVTEPMWCITHLPCQKPAARMEPGSQAIVTMEPVMSLILEHQLTCKETNRRKMRQVSPRERVNDMQTDAIRYDVNNFSIQRGPIGGV